MNKKMLLLIILELALILVTPLVGCMPMPAPTPTTTLNEYALSVARLQGSSSVRITEWTTGKIATLAAYRPDFTKMLQFINASTVIRTTTKTATTIENGKTVTIQRTVPYPMGYIVKFYFQDGSQVKFNVTSDNIWFETDAAIYQASVSPDLYSLLKEFITKYPSVNLGGPIPPPIPTPSPSPTPTPTPSSGVTSPSGSWTTFTTDDGLASNIVTGITQDNQGVLWVASDQGLTRFDGNSWEIYTGSTHNIHIVCAARDIQGNLWFGTYGDGAFEYTGKEWHNFTPGNTGNGLPGTAIKDILVDNQDNLWFATVGNVGQRTAPMDHGVTRYDGTDWTSFLDRTDVETIFQDSDGSMWFGTNVGVTRYDGSEWQTFTKEDGLADNYVVAIAQDSQGNMWFGTWADGVSRYDGKNWQTFTPEDGLVSDAIHCMLKDNQGNLWFGSYCIDGYYGISRFDGAQWQHFDPWPDTNTYNVISIFEDNEGNIWFATSIGLVRYTPD